MLYSLILKPPRKIHKENGRERTPKFPGWSFRYEHRPNYVKTPIDRPTGTTYIYIVEKRETIMPHVDVIVVRTLWSLPIVRLLNPPVLLVFIHYSPPWISLSLSLFVFFLYFYLNNRTFKWKKKYIHIYIYIEKKGIRVVTKKYFTHSYNQKRQNFCIFLYIYDSPWFFQKEKKFSWLLTFPLLADYQSNTCRSYCYPSISRNGF